MIAVHDTYLHEPAYRAASGFLETASALPRLPGPVARTEILASRARVAMGETTLAAGPFVTPTAVEVLFDNYRRGNTSVRTTSQIAHASLAYACDDGATTIDVAHVELAITEWDAGRRRLVMAAPHSPGSARA